MAGSLDIAAFDVYVSARHVRTVVDSTPSVRHRSARGHGTYPSAACCRVRPATTTRAGRLKPTDLSRPNAERIEVLGSSTIRRRSYRHAWLSGHESSPATFLTALWPCRLLAPRTGHVHTAQPALSQRTVTVSSDDLWVNGKEVAGIDLPQTFASLRGASRRRPREGHLAAMSANILLTRQKERAPSRFPGKGPDLRFNVVAGAGFEPATSGL